MTNAEIIRNFIEAWSRLDADELAEYFAEGGCYHNIPAQPVTGKENVRKFIQGFLSTWTETDWEILNLAEQDGVVYCERIDKTKTTQGDVDLPCFGVFEMVEGKISVWRDYFDMNTFMSAMKG